MNRDLLMVAVLPEHSQTQLNLFQINGYFAGCYTNSLNLAIYS